MGTEPFEHDPGDDADDLVYVWGEGELPVEELLRCARPTPPRSETAIPDLTDEEFDEFMAAIKR
jgi:hypothetical protein